jgi:hypothetical protein
MVSSTNVLKAPMAFLMIGGTDVGGTFEQLEFAIDNSVQDIATEDSLMAVDSFLSAREITASVTLAEITLMNLAIAWNLPAANVVSSSLLVDQGDRGMLSWLAVGKIGSAPINSIQDDGIRSFYFSRSRVVGNVPINLTKLDPSKLPVEFRFYSDRATGEAGTITDYNIVIVSARSSTLPLDGLPITETLFTALKNMRITVARAIYEEASSSHAGVAIELGKIGNVNFYSTYTSEPSKPAGTTSTLLLGNTLLLENETLTVKCAGGKTGLGSLKVQVELEKV